jgi:hypothetical protein
MGERRRSWPARRVLACTAAGILLAACTNNSPSTLDPHGLGAARVARLWWLLFWISAAVFTLVCLLVAAALARGRGGAGTGRPWCAAAAARGSSCSAAWSSQPSC